MKKQNSLLLYNKPLINALINIKLGTAIQLQQYDPPTKLTMTDCLTLSGIPTQESIPTLDKTTISARLYCAKMSSGLFAGIDINLDSIINKRFPQLICTIISTHLIEPIDHLNNENNSLTNSNSLNKQAGNTKNILENIDHCFFLSYPI
ncbi:unnamed protein product [Adineta steineri]|uniref:Uncharacterized protein n=1 Tax=Adineta steineri TaxID=433720 RepID=A0A814NE62_9BILA|nr:unnamed protein product [Adineta steineri]